MKKNTHPPYQKVLFIDSSTGTKFLIGSALQAKETGEFEGKTYPMVKIPVSSASHPFFTRSEKFIDSRGRVGRFTSRYKKNQEERKKQKEKEAKGPLQKNAKKHKKS